MQFRLDNGKIMKMWLNDIVSMLLGHSSMKITQDSYGEIEMMKFKIFSRLTDICNGLANS